MDWITSLDSYLYWDSNCLLWLLQALLFKRNKFPDFCLVFGVFFLFPLWSVAFWLCFLPHLAASLRFSAAFAQCHRRAKASGLYKLANTPGIFVPLPVNHKVLLRCVSWPACQEPVHQAHKEKWASSRQQQIAEMCPSAERGKAWTTHGNQCSQIRCSSNQLDQSLLSHLPSGLVAPSIPHHAGTLIFYWEGNENHIVLYWIMLYYNNCIYCTDYIHYITLLYYVILHHIIMLLSHFLGLEVSMLPPYYTLCRCPSSPWDSWRGKRGSHFPLSSLWCSAMDFNKCLKLELGILASGELGMGSNN